MGQRKEPWLYGFGVFVASLSVTLAYAAYTGHVWEDFFIAYRHGRNLALGNGLVYVPGERIQGFSSPLGVLLPALLCFLSRDSDPYLVLWLYRGITIPCLAGAAVLLWRLSRGMAWSTPTRILLVGMLVLDCKAVEFSIDGLESGFMLLGLTWILTCLAGDDPGRWWKLGLGWAGLMWTRPDAFIYFGLLCGSRLLLAGSRPVARGLALDYLKAGALCTLLYGPWFFGAWLYYGSPVPHTVVAKAQYHSLSEALAVLWKHRPGLFTTGGSFTGVFDPYYSFLGGWPALVPVVSTFLGLAAVVAGCLPEVPVLVRAATLTFLGGVVYLTSVSPAPWYYPSVALFGYLAGAELFNRLLGRARPLAVGLMGCLLLYQAGLLASVAYQTMVGQTVIEDGTRQQIGLWLKAHARPTDTVMLEPMGIIGFYSNLKVYDWPGLVSAEMVAVRKEHGDDWVSGVTALKPDWVVLRFRDLAAFAGTPGLLPGEYVPVRMWDSGPRLGTYGWGTFPGMPALGYDARFILYHHGPLEQ